MKILGAFLLSVVTVAPLYSFAAVNASAVSDIESMALRTDGQYDVKCKDGSQEVVTLRHIQLGFVCGGTAPIPTAGIVAIYARPQGDFNVLCKDDSWQVATAAAIQAGTVCPVMVISDGTQSKPFCSWQNSCSWGAPEQLECAQSLCKASGFSGGTFVEASNSPCDASFTNSQLWSWVLDHDNYQNVDFDNEARITARCL